MDETRITAALPSLDVEIVHRELPGEGAEMMTIHLKAIPSFEAVNQFLAPRALAALAALAQLNPFAIWMQAVQAAWMPLLGPLAPRFRIGSDERN